ncbi:MAG TPA: site-2 protease family protein, partial [Pseudomonadales bacterium]
MKWSWKIARIAGIDVSVHATFFLLLLWFALVSWRQSQELVAVFTSLAFIVTLFACVVMHEFGHALTARRFGISTRSITLLPIGGVAALEKMPDDPKQEILVALAGPAVNVVIAGVLWLYLSATMTPLTAEDVMAGRIPFWYQVMVVNIVLAVFNLLPAFPMDGGRVLRAALALFMPHNEATQKAARIGQSL